MNDPNSKLRGYRATGLGFHRALLRNLMHCLPLPESNTKKKNNTYAVPYVELCANNAIQGTPSLGRGLTFRDGESPLSVRPGFPLGKEQFEWDEEKTSWSRLARYHSFRSMPELQ